MRVVILVPRRNDGGHRDRLWDYVRAYLEAGLPDWEIYEGHHQQGPFNRSKAINTAAKDAGEWDVALIADSDTISDLAALKVGAEIAAAHKLMINCHDLRIMLTENATTQILDRKAGPIKGWQRRGFVERIWYESPSSSVIVRRDLWDRVGGFDEKFVGWGHEDSAFRYACETIADAPMLRVAANAYHLWHPESPEVSRRSRTRMDNMARMQKYQTAANSVNKVERIDRLTGVRP